MRWLLAALLLAGLQAAWAQDRLRFAGGWIEFASVASAREELARDDEWIATVGDYQRLAILPLKVIPSREDFRLSLKRSAQAWTETDRQRWSAALAAIEPAIARLRIRLPETVLLVATDGREAGGAPHTRGNAVFLPRGFSAGRYTDGELMAHELFHVLTRNDPALATRLYALFGFHAAQPLEWPAEWEQARISNPDSPHHRHVMWLDTGAGRQAVMPLLVARDAHLQPGQTFFDLLDVRLLAVEPGAPGQPTRALRRDGRLVWQHAYAVPDYLRQLGGNTAYAFDAEEVAADNFALLVSGRAAPHPALLERMHDMLLRQAPSPSQTPPRP